MMSSQPSQFTFPETLGGQHKISTPKPSNSKQMQSTERCIYVVQEYNCPHHPTLNTPHIFHRTPCPQALLPPASQTDCTNYPQHTDELVQVSRYVLDRGCMECKILARARRHEEAAKHPEIHRRMQELGLGQEDIDHFEKVTSSFPASRRVLELVRAREKLKKEELRRMEGEEEAQNQIETTQESAVQSTEDNVEVIPPTTLASSTESPIIEENDSAEKQHQPSEVQPTTTKVKSPPRTKKILVKNNAPQSTTQFTELETPKAIIAPKAEQSDELSQPQPGIPPEADRTPHPPPSTEEEEEESPPSPEKLTDNIHLELDEEWDWAEESERVFGEVALAPSFGCQTGDEWIVVGSWEQ
ncbi:hypothetical protein EAE96_008391 [Botrytis aclada]|nr:hypothetical protein EAE96_008391 [Botrytis aclada]